MTWNPKKVVAASRRSVEACLAWNSLPLALLILLAAATMVFFDRPLIRGDGVAYLAWLDTLVLDRDLDFGNQLERLRSVNTYQISWSEESQRLVNVFPFGVAILQAPFYLLGHLFLARDWWNLNPDYFQQMQGIGLPYSLWLMIGANIMTLGSLVMAWTIGKRLAGPWMAAIVSWALFVGSPLIYYSTVSPLNSHGAGTFLTTAFVFLLADLTGLFAENKPASPPSGYKWLLLGLTGGLMILVRWQLGLVLVAGLGLLALRGRRKELLVVSLVSTMTALPLPVIWQQMFGQPLVVPYEAATGRSFLDMPNHSLSVLGQTVIHSPLLLLSLAGIPFLWRIDRAWTAFAVLAIGAQVVLNGMVLDWWAGETYGMRRMTELYPLYVILACIALSKTMARGNASDWWPPASRSIFLLFLAYTVLYIPVFFNFTWTNPDHVFIADPPTMLRHFFNQDGRWQITASVFRAHLGPGAWSMPGP